jgi:hypothetical protein
VSVALKTNEWNSLNDQFRALVRDEPSRDESLKISLIMKSGAALAKR